MGILSSVPAKADDKALGAARLSLNRLVIAAGQTIRPTRGK